MSADELSAAIIDLFFRVEELENKMAKPTASHPKTVGELRAQIVEAIEDVFVRTLQIDLEQDVPLLADNIMALIDHSMEVSEPGFETLGDVVERLHGTTDAQVWAKTFWDMWGERLMELDFYTVLTWFANAIETGRPTSDA